MNSRQLPLSTAPLLYTKPQRALRKVAGFAIVLLELRPSAGGQLHQCAKGITQDAVGLLALDVGDEADATGVVFELWVVKTLGIGCGQHIRPWRFFVT